MELYQIVEFLGAAMFSGNKHLVNIVKSYLPWWKSLLQDEESAGGGSVSMVKDD
jgi:hypothetical protein